MAVKANWYFTGHRTLSGGKDRGVKAGRTHSISPCVSEIFLGGISWLQSEAGLGACMAQQLAQEPALGLVLFGMNTNDQEDK